MFLEVQDRNSDEGLERQERAIKPDPEVNDQKFKLQQEIGKEVTRMEDWKPFDDALTEVCQEARRNFSEMRRQQWIDTKNSFTELISPPRFSEDAHKKAKEFCTWLARRYMQPETDDLRADGPLEGIPRPGPGTFH